MEPIVRAGINYRRLLRNGNATGLFTASNSGGPMKLHETWGGAIDTTNQWTRTLGGSGTATVGTLSGWRQLPLASAATTDTVSVIARFAATNPIGLAAAMTDAIYKRAVMEWECRFLNVANMDNSKTAMLITYGATGTRDDNGAAGFVLDGDLLQTLTDNAGTEELNAVTPAPTLTVVNLLRIEVDTTGMDFYVNDSLVKRHSTSANLPTAALQPAFYNVSDAAAASTLRIGAFRFWMEEN